MTTRETKLLRTSLVLGAALLLLAPLASFAGAWSVSVGVGGPAYVGYGYGYAPGYVWRPGCYEWGPAGGYYWAPGAWVAPPFAGAAWIGPHWGWVGGRRIFIHGHFGHRFHNRPFPHRPFRRW